MSSTAVPVRMASRVTEPIGERVVIARLVPRTLGEASETIEPSFCIAFLPATGEPLIVTGMAAPPLCAHTKGSPFRSESRATTRRRRFRDDQFASQT